MPSNNSKTHAMPKHIMSLNSVARQQSGQGPLHHVFGGPVYSPRANEEKQKFIIRILEEALSITADAQNELINDMTGIQ